MGLDTPGSDGLPSMGANLIFQIKIAPESLPTRSNECQPGEIYFFLRK
jgi:hypothetical protein